MSENRSLALVEIKVYLSSVIPDRYVLGAAEIPDDLDVGRGRPVGGPLFPSVISGERNYALVRAYRIRRADSVSLRFAPGVAGSYTGHSLI